MMLLTQRDVHLFRIEIPSFDYLDISLCLDARAMQNPHARDEL